MHVPEAVKDLIRAEPCLACGADPPSVYAHFPRTKVHDDIGIPLCGKCHHAQHQLGIWSWLSRNPQVLTRLVTMYVLRFHVPRDTD